MTMTQSEECWSCDQLSPSVSFEYNPRGSWRQVGELYTYCAGPIGTAKGIVLIYDAFGPSPQILQGADRLADHLNISILVPDFFKGCSLEHDEFMRDLVNGRAAMKEHMKGHADLDKNTATTLRYMKDANTKFPTVQAWGVLGLCWGGKVAVLSSIAENTPFKASVQAHPSGMDVDDARFLRTPHLCMPSGDEPVGVVEEYARILQHNCVGSVALFGTMEHGWMGARANLSDRDNRNEYERGYAMVARFFSQHL